MVSRVLISKNAPKLAAICTCIAVTLISISSTASDGSGTENARTPHASFQHNGSMNSESQQMSWTTGIQTTTTEAEGSSASLVTLERPALLLGRDGFGIVRGQSRPAFRLSDYSLSIDLIRLGEAFKATAEWYRRPRKVAADAKLVVDSFYHFGKEVVDEGLVLVRSRSEQKGLQAKVGPTWMRGGPAARLKVSF